MRPLSEAPAGTLDLLEIARRVEREIGLEFDHGQSGSGGAQVLLTSGFRATSSRHGTLGE